MRHLNFLRTTFKEDPDIPPSPGLRTWVVCQRVAGPMTMGITTPWARGLRLITKAHTILRTEELPMHRVLHSLPQASTPMLAHHKTLVVEVDTMTSLLWVV